MAFVGVVRPTVNAKSFKCNLHFGRLDVDHDLGDSSEVIPGKSYDNLCIDRSKGKSV